MFIKCIFIQIPRSHITFLPWYWGAIFVVLTDFHDLNVCYYGSKLIKFHHIKMRLLQFLQILPISIMNINLHLHPNSSYYQMCISKRQKCFIINPLVVFGLLSLSLCSRSKMTGLQTTAYKSVIMLYYHQILDSIFLSTCFLSFRTGFVFLFASVNRRPYLSESRHLLFWVKKSFFMNNFHNMR